MFKHLHSSRWSLPSFLVALVLLLSFTTARANDFAVIGSRTRAFTTSTNAYVPVQKFVSDTLRVYATIVGSSHFSVTPSSVYYNLSDTGKTFTVSFSTTTSDTSYALLILTDYSTSDTVRLTGFDTAYTHHSVTRDFEELSVVRSLVLMPSHDSTKGYVVVRRLADTTVALNVSIQGTGNWSIGDTGVRSISQNLTSGTAYYYIPIIYWSSRHEHDSARLILSADHPLVQRDTFYIYGSDSNYSVSSLRLSLSGASFDTTIYYDTTCRTIYISNPNTSSVTLTSISLPSSNGGYAWISSAPTLPRTLAGGDSVGFTVCYTPYFSGASSIAATVHFTDSAGNSGAESRSYAFVGAQCFDVLSDSILVDDVYLGGYVDVPVRVHFNKSYSNVSWSGDSTGVLTLLGSNPFSATQGETKTLTFRVRPDAVGWIYRYSYLSAGGCTEMLQVFGQAIPNGRDTINLFSGSTDVLAVHTASDTLTHTFTFRNNSGSTMRITNVSLATGSHFTITGIHPHATPDTLANMAMLAVDLLFVGDTNGTYDDSLTIEAEGMLQSLTFHIRAIKNTLSVTPIDRVPLTLSVVPNPVTGPVTIELNGAEHAQIEIYDLLGNRIAESAGRTTWTWNSAPAVHAAYIVRATAEVNGVPHTISQRIVVTH